MKFGAIFTFASCVLLVAAGPRNAQCNMNVDLNDECATPVHTIVYALSLAGFRHPIGRRECHKCKKACYQILIEDCWDKCKYDACVRYLGDYTGDEPTPGCGELSRP